MPTTYTDIQGSKAVPVGGTDQISLIRSMDGRLSSLPGVQQEVARTSQNLRILNEQSMRMQGLVLNVEHQVSILVEAISSSISDAAAEVIDRVKPVLDNAVRAAEAITVGATARAEASNRGGGVGSSGPGANSPFGWQTPSGAPLGTEQNPAVVTTIDRPLAERTDAGTPSENEDLKKRLEKLEKDKETKEKAEPARSPLEISPVSQRGHGSRLSHTEPTEADDSEGPLGVRDAWAQGRGTSIGDLQHALTRKVGERFQNFGRGGLHLGQVEGEWHHFEAGKDTGRVASAEELHTFMGANKARSVLANYGGELAKSGSVLEGLGALAPGLLSKVGPVGIFTGAALKTRDFEMEQRAKNNAFVQIEGGTQGQAMQERAEGAKFRYGQAVQSFFGGGGLNATQSDELFMGATRIGLHGQERQQALNFSTENFRKFGMDIQSSLDLVSVAAESGVTNLEGVAKGLDAVTKAAVAGGINTQKAQQLYLSTWQAASQTTASGTAVASSAGLTSTFSKQGKEYQGIDLKGVYSPEMLQRLAANDKQHRTADQIAQLPGAELNAMHQALVTNTLRTQFSDPAKARIEQLVKAAPRGADGKMTAETIKDIMKTIRHEGLAPSSQVMQNTLSSLGVSGVPQILADDVALQYTTGNVSEIDGAASVAVRGVTTVQSDKDKTNLATALGLSADDTKLKAHEDFNNHAGADRTRRTYLQNAMKSGKASPIIEALLKDWDPNRRIQVKGKTKSGQDEDRVVTVQEALAHYQDQIAEGGATIVQGKGAGGSVAEAVGLSEDSSVSVNTNVKNSGKVGIKADTWASKYGTSQNDKGGTLVVSPDPLLAKYLKFTPFGNVAIGDTAPPVPTGTVNRPTG